MARRPCRRPSWSILPSLSCHLGAAAADSRRPCKGLTRSASCVAAGPKGPSHAAPPAAFLKYLASATRPCGPLRGQVRLTDPIAIGELVNGILVPEKCLIRDDSEKAPGLPSDRLWEPVVLTGYCGVGESF